MVALEVGADPLDLGVLVLEDGLLVLDVALEDEDLEELRPAGLDGLEGAVWWLGNLQPPIAGPPPRSIFFLALSFISWRVFSIV